MSMSESIVDLSSDRDGIDELSLMSVDSKVVGMVTFSRNDSAEIVKLGTDSVTSTSDVTD
jgi:hypothetical protein